MPSDSRTHRWARRCQWVSLGAAALCAAGLVLRPDFEADLSHGYSVRMQEGRLAVLMWPTPRDHPDSAGPDTRPLPLPLLLGLGLAVAAGCWRLGRRGVPTTARSGPRCSG